MKTKHTFTNRGFTWDCTYNDEVGYWLGISGDFKVTAGSWDELKEELSSMDLSQVRQDAVAVCNPIEMGIITGF